MSPGGWQQGGIHEVGHGFARPPPPGRSFAELPAPPPPRQRRLEVLPKLEGSPFAGVIDEAASALSMLEIHETSARTSGQSASVVDSFSKWTTYIQGLVSQLQGPAATPAVAEELQAAILKVAPPDVN